MNRIMPAIALTPVNTQAVTPKPAAGAAGANAAAAYAAAAGSISDAGSAGAAGKVLGRNSTSAPDFTSLLGNMLSEVSQAQARSTQMNQRLQLGDPKTTIEDTVLAMNTASVQFQMVVQVRNKLVQSYTDIMNMPV